MAAMPINEAVFLLGEAREKPMHVGGLQVFEPPAGAGPHFVTDMYENALADGGVRPELARRAERGLGGLGPWRWRTDPDIDLAYHVRHSALPHPRRVRELLALVSRLHGTLLDRSRPLWEAHLIEGLDDGRFAVYTKVHHALVDGVSAMRMMERALSRDPDETGMPPPWAEPARVRRPARAHDDAPWLPARTARAVRTAGQAVTGASLAAIRSVLTAFREEAVQLPYQAPRSMLNVPITGARRFAADKWELERIQQVAQASGSTINDVVLAMCAGALRRYLAGFGALPEDPLVAMVPVSLRAADDERTGNAVGAVLCNLGTHVDDAATRLALVRSSMRQGKLSLRGLTPEAVLVLSALNVAPLGLGPLFRFEPLRRPPFNVVISNVPGPQEPLFHNGARMTGSYPVSIPYDGQALNITVSSYAGAVSFGLTACRRSVPSVQQMLEHLEASLGELEREVA